jgi:hypothetical protein
MVLAELNQVNLLHGNHSHRTNSTEDEHQQKFCERELPRAMLVVPPRLQATLSTATTRNGLMPFLLEIWHVGLFCQAGTSRQRVCLLKILVNVVVLPVF